MNTNTIPMNRLPVLLAEALKGSRLASDYRVAAQALRNTGFDEEAVMADTVATSMENADNNQMKLFEVLAKKSNEKTN